mgnify:CR=1 FL=1
MPGSRKRPTSLHSSKQSTGGRPLIAFCLVSLLLLTFYVREGDSGIVHSARGAVMAITSPVRMVGAAIASPFGAIGTAAGNLTASAQAGGLDSISEQIVGCLVVMMWVFVGMEGATVLGHRARRKADVSRATILGTFALVLIYVAASILPYGFMTRAQIAALDAPSMIYLFRAAAGDAGGAFIAVGLIVSILGAWLSYTILASEAMQSMAEMHLLPHLFARKNRHGAPVASLIATGTMIQALTLTMLLAERAYEFAYSLCTMVIMPAWALAAAYMIVCSLRERTPGRLVDATVATIAVVFLAAATVIAGIDMLVLSSLAYVPGIILYAIARRRFELPIMQTTFEYALGALILLALISVF